MKKAALIVLAVLISIFLVLFLGSLGDAQLDPAAQKALAVRLPELAPEDNIYVGLSGFTLIHDGDPVTAGLKYLQNKDHFQNTPPENPGFDFSYKNPCLAPKAPANCLEQIVAEAPAIEKAIRKNSELIERYHFVQKMPSYVNTSFDIIDPVPHFGRLIDTSRLIGAKALLDIKQNGLAAGLGVLERELAFYHKIGRSEHIGLLDSMILDTLLLDMATELSKVIEDSQIELTSYEERLRIMLDFVLNHDRIITAALNTEKRHMLRSFAQWPEGLMDDEKSLMERQGNAALKLLFKKNMTLNLLVARFDKAIAQIQTAPWIDFPDYFARHLAEAGELESNRSQESGIKRLYREYGLFFYKNYAGQSLADIVRTDYMRYLARMRDVMVYSHLVRAQLELRLGADRLRSVPEALSGLGAETWNPYTGQPFDWDEEKAVLWAEKAGMAGLTKRDAPLSERRLEVSVPARQR